MKQKGMAGKLILAISLMFSITTTYAGPFGLSMGMTKNQLEQLESTDNKFVYKTSKVPKPSSQFDTYILQIGDKNGLCVIKALTDVISTNRYGFSVKERFKSLEKALEEKYGSHKIQDLLLSGSIWDQPEDFMVGLTKNERFLRAYWDEEEHSTMSDNIRSIALVAVGVSNETGIVYIQYEFSNTDKCEEELKVFDSDTL
jgi:hypothetical protein